MALVLLDRLQSEYHLPVEEFQAAIQLYYTRKCFSYAKEFAPRAQSFAVERTEFPTLRFLLRSIGKLN
jgi:hypothetical protein